MGSTSGNPGADTVRMALISTYTSLAEIFAGIAKQAAGARVVRMPQAEGWTQLYAVARP